MKQKILTYYYPVKDEELVHVIEENMKGLLEEGWHAVSISQSVYPTKRKGAHGIPGDYNELAVSVLYEKND